MREIKFRAWLKEERKMVNVETLFIGINRLCFGNSKTEDLFFRDFEEVELMQYTGVKDKNGKEIYEGDITICKYGPQIAMEVKWVDEGFRTLGKYDGDNIKIENEIRYIAKVFIDREEIEDESFSSLTFEETAKHVLKECVISNYFDMAEMEVKC